MNKYMDLTGINFNITNLSYFKNTLAFPKIEFLINFDFPLFLSLPSQVGKFKLIPGCLEFISPTS